MKNNNNLGFTLMELVVVMSLMILLMSMVFITTGSIRIKARDTRRVAMVTQVQNVLESYYRNVGMYPLTADVQPGSPLTDGVIEYMVAVPNNPSPQDDGDCLEEDFSYTQINGGTSYEFNFCLGKDSGDLSAGNNVAMPAGIMSN